MQESETIYVIEYKRYWYYYIFHIKLFIQPNWHYYAKQFNISFLGCTHRTTYIQFTIIIYN